MNHKKQILFFILVGSLAALTHFIVLWLSVSLFHIHPILGNILGFSIAFIASFSGHYLLTFAVSKTSLTHSVWRWLFSSLFTFFANQGLFMIGLKLLSEKYYLIIWLIVTVVLTVSSFLLGKFWAFKQV